MYSEAEVAEARKKMLLAKLAYLDAERVVIAMTIVDISDRQEVIGDIDDTFRRTAIELANIGLHARVQTTRVPDHRGLPFKRGQNPSIRETGMDSGGNTSGC